MGLSPVMMQWFSAPKTNEKAAEDGFTIHAGMSETSSRLYLVPHLVDWRYQHALSIRGTDMASLIRVASELHWPGYFGAERLVTEAYGKRA